jgi:hypothetical protein
MERVIGADVFRPSHMPCESCGASVKAAAEPEHVCDWNRWLDYRVFQERGDVEGDVAAFLESPRGRFELWYAERERHRP